MKHSIYFLLLFLLNISGTSVKKSIIYDYIKSKPPVIQTYCIDSSINVQEIRKEFKTMVYYKNILDKEIKEDK